MNNHCACLCVGDGGWMPVPTHLQQCCDPASLVLVLVLLVQVILLKVHVLGDLVILALPAITKDYLDLPSIKTKIHNIGILD